MARRSVVMMVCRRPPVVADGYDGIGDVGESSDVRIPDVVWLSWRGYAGPEWLGYKNKLGVA